MQRFLIAALAALFTALLLPVQAANAVPIQGALSWSILLCKFSDRPQEPQPPQFFKDFLLPDGKGQKGAHDFFEQQSRGRALATDSVVKGWYTMPYTWQQSKDASRRERIDQCLFTAIVAGYIPPAHHRIAVLLNDQGVDTAGADRTRIVLDVDGWQSGVAVHEMLHTYGVGHSFSNSTQNLPGYQPGEYDDAWDIMSASGHFGQPTDRFGKGVVGSNGPLLDEVGWLPSNRVVTAGQDGRTSMTVQLAPLERQDLPGLLLLRVPFDANDLTRYFTVEFRKKTGVSSGIPNDIALIHELRKGVPYLLRDLSKPTRDPVQQVSANGVTIRIDEVTASYATVTVTSNMANTCLSGLVYRNAVPGDNVCVTPASRDQVAADNRTGRRADANGRCPLFTFVRKATPADNLCVSPGSATMVATENVDPASRINPTKQFFGPNTCRPGSVWRGADENDQVCVLPAVYDQTRADNASRASRWTNGPSGPQTCISGYVWREAFLGDTVCVTGAVRDRTWKENQDAWARTWPARERSPN
ncbi:hypothetical protein ABZU75_46255 [Streptosporangium sp. NPDC005286]|uniref:hypothetical protein n=1 Tax=Streptosporangium sp. NPDC005286 TaxID=3154463 RepID=UPI0033BE2325